MSEMIERMAAASYEAAWAAPGGFEALDESGKATMRKRMAAVLMVLREPTEAMLAALDAYEDANAIHPTGLGAWAVMIDEALK